MGFVLGCPGPQHKNPKELGQITQGLYIMVNHIYKHYLCTKRALAKLLDEPADQFYGGRRYYATDPEGLPWYFAQHIRDVSVQKMQRKMSGG